VVDLRQGGPDDEQPLLENAGMKFYSIPMTASDPPSEITIHQFLQVVNDPANQPVFVHCEDGHIRTGVMTAVYRITHDGWTADQAYAEMKKYHFHCFWRHALKRHHALKHFVYRYYDSIHSSACRQSRKLTTGLLYCHYSERCRSDPNSSPEHPEW